MIRTKSDEGGKQASGLLYVELEGMGLCHRDYLMAPSDVGLGGRLCV